MRTHLNITQSGLIALLTTIVGQVVAFVPSLSADKAVLISAGSAVISAAFLLANSVHALGHSNVTADEVRRGASNLVRSEVGKVDFNQLVQDAVSARGGVTVDKVEALVENEVQTILAKAFSGQALNPAPSAPPVPPAV